MSEVRPGRGVAQSRTKGKCLSLNAAPRQGGRAQQRLHTALLTALSSEVTPLSLCQNWP